jgi:hypothetical protein
VPKLSTSLWANAWAAQFSRLASHFYGKPTFRPHGLPSETLKILRGLKA